jgi:hypothetical protein
MKISRFEDIEAWQEARKLVNMVYETIRSDRKFTYDFRFINQIQAAAVSVIFVRRNTYNLPLNGGRSPKLGEFFWI